MPSRRLFVGAVVGQAGNHPGGKASSNLILQLRSTSGRVLNHIISLGSWEILMRALRLSSTRRY
jgi:hypothetical protein